MLNYNTEFLVNGPILPSTLFDLYNQSNNDSAGANSVFTGQVRADSIHDQKVVAIEYSAYPEMVNTEILSIIQNAIQKYDDLKQIHILHSVGLVKTGEISILVFVASGHRMQCFEAIQYLVNEIKAKVPIWKKEIFENNMHRWPSNH